MINELAKLPCRTKFKAKDNQGHEVRCLKESDTSIFVFAKGKSRYGSRYTVEMFLNNFVPIIVSPAQEEKSWHRRCKNIEQKLKINDLWPDLQILFHNLQQVSLADKKDMYALYMSRDASANGKLATYYKTKYPFAFNESGNLDTSYIWELSDAQTKPMYFGKRVNARIKQEIKHALAMKTAYNYTGTVGYDVSYRYDPTKKGAWYSEEYRNCGNGHYYVAIDESCALFCEND